MRRAVLALCALLAVTEAMADNFTYNIQLAGYGFDQFDEKGAVNYAQFLDVFRTFPWKSQVGKANGRSEPTISVRNGSNNTDYWVSAMKHGDGHVYVVGIVYPKEKPGLFGIGKPKMVRWVEIYVAERAAIVDETSRMFFAGRNDELRTHLRALPKLGEMESRK